MGLDLRLGLGLKLSLEKSSTHEIYSGVQKSEITSKTASKWLHCNYSAHFSLKILLQAYKLNVKV